MPAVMSYLTGLRSGLDVGDASAPLRRTIERGKAAGVWRPLKIETGKREASPLPRRSLLRSPRKASRNK